MRYPRIEGRGRSRADLVAVIVLLAGAGLVASLDSARELQIVRAVRQTVLRPFLLLHDTMEERARLAERAAELRSERDSLAAELFRLRALAEEGRQLRRLTGLPGVSEDDYVPVEVRSGRPRVGDSHVFFLRGRGLGEVRPPAGVVTGRGLVGVMRESAERGGRGEFWTHRDFRVSVRTEDGRASGIVEPLEEGAMVGMVLVGAPYQQEIPRGTPVLTSGVAGIYPPGVRVGTVDTVRTVQSGWARSYFVQPAVRPEQVQAALVWRRPAVPEAGERPAAGGPDTPADSGDGTDAPPSSPPDSFGPRAAGTAPPGDVRGSGSSPAVPLSAGAPAGDRRVGAPGIERRTRRLAPRPRSPVGGH